MDLDSDAHLSLQTQLDDLAEGTLIFRLPFGCWEATLTTPGVGCEESSGSALIAYAPGEPG